MSYEEFVERFPYPDLTLEDLDMFRDGTIENIKKTYNMSQNSRHPQWVIDLFKYQSKKYFGVYQRLGGSLSFEEITNVK